MPKIDKNRRSTPREFGHWVAEYNAAGIDIECRPPQSTIDQAARCKFVVCSSLPRSLDSAKALGIENIDVCESMFREMDMPYAQSHFPRLSLLAWTVIFRLMWLVGFSANAESFREGKKRANRCAERLMELASEHGTVLLVGHGSLNWLIARHLKSKGWSGAKKSPRRYWEFSVYRRHAT